MHRTYTLSAIISGVLMVVSGGQCGAATLTTIVNANTVKPLIITKVQDLNLGTVTLGPGVWSNVNIAVSQTGVLTCISPNVTCSGAVQAAEYEVQGSGQQTVQISAPNITLTNQSDLSQTLTLRTDAPASIVLKNSGLPGTNFSIGGSVTVSSSTSAGTYVGTFNVTVNY
ncbi:MAG TPA: DUF4402 domain-containing protein [Sphingomicrobium sp.]|nr:DUF4402 domain-containing protein [Sphingomicrobium sp.]